jgi:hypothetical protein
LAKKGRSGSCPASCCMLHGPDGPDVARLRVWFGPLFFFLEVPFISQLGFIFNFQFLAQPTPAAFTSAHVGSDSYNVAFMCAFLPALALHRPPCEVMHVYQCASYTLPCLPRVCAIYISLAFQEIPGYPGISKG